MMELVNCSLTLVLLCFLTGAVCQFYHQDALVVVTSNGYLFALPDIAEYIRVYEANPNASTSYFWNYMDMLAPAYDRPSDPITAMTMATTNHWQDYYLFGKNSQDGVLWTYYTNPGMSVATNVSINLRNTGLGMPFAVPAAIVSQMYMAVDDCGLFIVPFNAAGTWLVAKVGWMGEVIGYGSLNWDGGGASPSINLEGIGWNSFRQAAYTSMNGSLYSVYLQAGSNDNFIISPYNRTSRYASGWSGHVVALFQNQSYINDEMWGLFTFNGDPNYYLGGPITMETASSFTNARMIKLPILSYGTIISGTFGFIGPSFCKNETNSTSPTQAATAPQPTTETLSTVSQTADQLPINDNSESNSKNRSSNNGGMIAGVVIGLLVFVAIIAVGAFFFWRRRQQTKYSENIEQNRERNTTYSVISDISMKVRDSVILDYLTDVTINQQIGEGNFGEVYDGKWQSVDVALKKLKTVSNMTEFIKEANVLQQLNHPYIVRYFGIYSDPQWKYMVFEYMSHGPLHKLLQDDQKISNDQLLLFVRDVAAGMTYLESQSVIHRDLAARNLLVKKEGGRFVAKVADFGLAKINENEYTLSKESQLALPIKWCAPEVLTHRKFSTKSDVWSFGVVIWEIYTRGEAPYGSKSNSETTEYVLHGGRMTSPKDCPTEIWTVVMSCWNEDVSSRPTFKQIFDECGGLITAQHIPLKQSSDAPNTTISSDNYSSMVRGAETTTNQTSEYSSMATNQYASMLRVTPTTTTTTDAEGDQYSSIVIRTENNNDYTSMTRVTKQ